LASKHSIWQLTAQHAAAAWRQHSNVVQQQRYISHITDKLAAAAVRAAHMPFVFIS
jgi:hypothetical protein